MSKTRAKTESETKCSVMSDSLEALVSLLSAKFGNDADTKGAEAALPYFDGESDINSWFKNFEANAVAYNWTNMQKFIFAKNKMKKVAELFLQTKMVTNYVELKEALISEFDKKYSSAEIHDQLRVERKTDGETFLEFMLHMRNIGAKANIDELSIIRYIVDGIRGKSEQKIGMYGAKNYNELRRQYEIFEHLASVNQNQQHKRKFNVNHKVKKEHCFNCGSIEHKVAECNAEGPKCFKCNKMGHIAKFCKMETTKNVALNRVQDNRNMIKEATVNSMLIPCLVDSGAEVSIIKKTVASTLKTKMNKYKQMIVGIGGRVKPEGVIQVKVILDGIETTQHFVVVPDNAICFDAILGFDIISKFKYFSDKNGYTFAELITEDLAAESDNPLMVMSAAVEQVAYEVPCKYEVQIRDLVAAYKPNTKRVESPISMKITVNSDKKIHHLPSRLAMAEREVVRQQVEQWLNDDIIRPSASEYCSRLVVVSKKDGGSRVCVDFRELNRLVEKERFPVPLIEEVIEELRDAVVFSIIDLENAYFHIPVDEDSKKFTAFICREGVYEFNKAPFGFCNSPAVFLRFVNCIFRKLINNSLIQIYMDDIIIYAKSEEEGLMKLETVLNVAAEFGLNIKWKKCRFLQRKVSYLGFVLEDGNIQPDESKVAAIRNFPLPKSVKDIQSFLGLSGFFRKFVQHYAVIAKPLTMLLKKDVTFYMGEEQKAAVERIKYILSNEPILKIFSPTAETELHCDASKEGFGAVLMQKFANKWHPVYFWSKKCGKEDVNRHSYYLEIKAAFLAVRRLKHYLWGKDFKLITDCEAFKNTASKMELVPAVARYILYLQEFRYVIEHRKGSKMRHADALSRYPVVMSVVSQVTDIFGKAQEEDEHIRAIKKILSSEQYQDYKIIGGILYKQREGRNLVVVPKRMEGEIIRNVHEKGHWATDKTKQRVEQEYFIPHLRGKVEKVVLNCVKCILFNKKLGRKEGFLHPIDKGDRPLMDIHVDHIGPMDSTTKLYKYMLTVVDAFSKFVWIYPTKSTTAEETVRKLQDWTKIFGAPQRIISDRGTAFTGNCFKDWCKEEQIELVLVTTGVARGNGQVERINRTILNILSKLSVDKPEQWYKHVNKTQRAINSALCSTTKFSPFELMFGVKMRNELDMMLNEYLKSELIDAFALQRDENRMLAKKQIVEAQESYKKQFDKKRKEEQIYEVGDQVAIRRTQFVAGRKLASEFLGPYIVSKCKRHGRYEVRKVGDFEGPQNTATSCDNMKPWASGNWESDLSGSDMESDGRM